MSWCVESMVLVKLGREGGRDEGRVRREKEFV